MGYVKGQGHKSNAQWCNDLCIFSLNSKELV